MPIKPIQKPFLTAADLRELALQRGTAPRPLVLVLDEDLRIEAAQAIADLDRLEAARAKMVADGDLTPAAPRNLADKAGSPMADIDRLIESCREMLADIETEAKESGQVLVTRWRRLAPKAYDAIKSRIERESVAEARADQAKAPEQRLGIDAAQLFLQRVGDALIEKCFDGCEAPDGDPVELSLDELLDTVCDHRDVQTLRDHCIAINRTGQAVDFHRASSGQAAHR